MAQCVSKRACPEQSKEFHRQTGGTIYLTKEFLSAYRSTVEDLKFELQNILGGPRLAKKILDNNKINELYSQLQEMKDLIKFTDSNVKSSKNSSDGIPLLHSASNAVTGPYALSDAIIIYYIKNQNNNNFTADKVSKYENDIMEQFRKIAIEKNIIEGHDTDLESQANY